MRNGIDCAMRYPLIKIKENDTCAEIGVWKGGHASEILRKKPRKLHLIDPWVHQDYKKMWYSIPQKKWIKFIILW